MSAERHWWVLIWVIIYAVLNTGSLVTALVWAPATENNLVLNIEPSSFNLQFSPGQSTFVSIKITNWSTTSWRTGEFYLQTVLPSKDVNYPLSPICSQPLWSSNGQTLSYKSDWQTIDFGQNFDFQLPITAPKSAGFYRFYLQPMVSQSPTQYLIKIDLKVGQPENILPVLPPKLIDISLQNQTATIFEEQYQLAQFIVSTGRQEWETPPGRYVINKKLIEVFSDDPINLWLPYWMELRDLNGVYEGYGIHGVPYRKVNSMNYQEGKRYSYSSYYSDGKLYEGYFALGKPISQGCVVLSSRDAETIYHWAEPNQTLVNIQ